MTSALLLTVAKLLTVFGLQEGDGKDFRGCEQQAVYLMNEGKNVGCTPAIIHRAFTVVSHPCIYHLRLTLPHVMYSRIYH